MEEVAKIIGIVASASAGLWAYVRFVAKPEILAEVDKKFINRELYQLQTRQILDSLAEIKSDIREIKNKLEGV